MAWDDIAAGISGGIDNVLRTLSWVRDSDLQSRALDEREAARRDNNNARGVDLMFRERRYQDELAESSLERQEGERRQRVFDEWFATLPAEMKNFLTAKKAGITTTLSDWEDPATKSLRDADERGQKYLDDELKHTRTLEADRARSSQRLRDDLVLESTRHGHRLREKDSVPVSPKDDPSLPTGVRAYLGSMLEKHGGQFEPAEAEWNRAFNEQLAKHPHLDAGKARSFLKELFGYEKPDPIEWAMQGDAARGSRARGFEAPTVNAASAKQTDATDALQRDLNLSLRKRSSNYQPGNYVPQELKDGGDRLSTALTEITEPPSDDRPSPSSPGHQSEKLQRLGSQIDSLMTQIKTAPTAAQRNAFRRQLKPVLEAYAKAGGS